MKKLDLSPLPEQTQDYSHYQETEVRWDRIVAFALAIVCTIALVIYLVFFQSTSQQLAPNNKLENNVEHSPESANASPHQDVKTEIEAVPKVKSGQNVQIGSQGQILSDNVNAKDQSLPGLEQVSSFEVSSVLKTGPKTEGLNSKEAIKELDSANTEVSSKESSKESVKKGAEVENSAAGTLPPEMKDEHSSTISIAEKPVLELAPTIIVNSGIEKAVLSLSNDQPLPGDPMEKVVSMNDRGLIKVALYTVMKGIRGKTLYHEWYRNDVRLARVRIPVNVMVQKSYSSKFIDRQMLGHWKVKVVDKDGEPYVLADFEVIR